MIEMHFYNLMVLYHKLQSSLKDARPNLENNALNLFFQINF